MAADRGGEGLPPASRSRSALGGEQAHPQHPAQVRHVGGDRAALFELPEEKSLHRSLTDVDALVTRKFAQGDYVGSLTALASVRSDVDAFFDKVLVNAEDERVRANRLALLTRLARVMNQVADISRLSA